MNLEIIPVFPGSESFLALRCYPRLREIPGKIDIVQVFTAATSIWSNSREKPLQNRSLRFGSKITSPPLRKSRRSF
jgi:predicted CoA-binding protein